MTPASASILREPEPRGSNAFVTVVSKSGVGSPFVRFSSDVLNSGAGGSTSYTPDLEEQTIQYDVTIEPSRSHDEDAVLPLTLSGDATHNVDWRVESPNPLVIPAGQTSGTIRIVVAEDGAVDGDEIRRIQLSPSGQYRALAVPTAYGASQRVHACGLHPPGRSVSGGDCAGSVLPEPLVVYWKKIDTASVKLLDPLSRYQAWKFQVSPG
ncbi:MAG: hypothetical protein GY711_20900 [bacterium]|nr:hypothetical protein [bacterium]